MRIIDSVLAVLGLAGFAGFLAIVAAYVPEPVLIVIFVACVAMAAYDFAQEIMRKRYGRR
ncbi:hypothetical protein IGS68_11895 [Skermanella sp. TT6]|uniref:Uncharacterized protein n=1 Tax=Skermanella cutis TaxID=2775420 RepID=A0ABX7BCD0_9PROT|nr:hypothetical protein [Skermanella sp. TT6]QQP91857.1 hypothetical protein IGS68_11895 [Skermanella sp. TT6]